MPNLPEALHVTRANEHTKQLFDWLIKEKRTIERVLDLPLEQIDMELAFQTFDPVAYRIAFVVTEGDITLLNSPYVSNEVLQAALAEWPEQYFLEYCVKQGLSYKFEIDSRSVYAIKEAHKEEVKTILNASANKSGV